MARTEYSSFLYECKLIIILKLDILIYYANPMPISLALIWRVHRPEAVGQWFEFVKAKHFLLEFLLKWALARGCNCIMMSACGIMAL